MITHLFYVNDSLVFTRANSNDCTAIMDVLKLYED